MYRPKFSQKNKLGARGLSLLMVIMVTAIVGVTLAILGEMVTRIVRTQQRNDFVAILGVLRDDYVFLLKDNRAWANTVRNNASTACLKQASLANCALAAAPGKAFAPYTSDNVLLAGYNALSATDGYTLQGVRCTTYPNINCPVHIDFYWNPTAPGIDPQVNLTVSFKFALPLSSQFGVFNSAKYDPPVITRSGTEVYIAAQSGCAAHQVITGINADGTPICTASSTFQPPPPPPPPPPAKAAKAVKVSDRIAKKDVRAFRAGLNAIARIGVDPGPATSAIDLMLIRAIQEQQTQIEELKNKINRARGRP